MPSSVQASNEIIDVAIWDPDPEWEFVSQGIKPKKWLRAPGIQKHNYIIPNKRYLFKYASSEQESRQIYSEAIAYELSRTLKISVPPVFLAIDSKTGRFGCLIESFLDSNSESDTRFIHGVELFQRVRAPIDERRGSLRDNIRLSRAFKAPNALDWWKKTVAFDALIGNTDRHSENWGLLVRREPYIEPLYELAPPFDHGTSLGWRIDEGAIAAHSTATAIQKFVDRGRHHYGWVSADRSLSIHHLLCGHLKRLFGDASRSMQHVIQLSDSEIERVAHWASHFDAPFSLSEQRAEFIVKLTMAKRKALEEALGE